MRTILSTLVLMVTTLGCGESCFEGEICHELTSATVTVPQRYMEKPILVIEAVDYETVDSLSREMLSQQRVEDLLVADLRNSELTLHFFTVEQPSTFDDQVKYYMESQLGLRSAGLFELALAVALLESDQLPDDTFIIALSPSTRITLYDEGGDSAEATPTFIQHRGSGSQQLSYQATEGPVSRGTVFLAVD